jgi:hypothetical protein
MDISEVLGTTVNALFYFAVLGCVFAGLYFAFRSRRVWLFIVVAFCSIFLEDRWIEFSRMAVMTVHHAPIYSPDRKHVAIISWTLSSDSRGYNVHVRLRSRYSPFATEVFTGIVQNPSYPEVLWTDDKHLLVSYPKEGGIERCQKPLGAIQGVEVTCRE